MASEVRVSTRLGAQDTGNPVLDSLVNVLAGNLAMANNAQLVDALHAALLQASAKEPGGLKRRGQNGALVPANP